MIHIWNFYHKRHILCQVKINQWPGMAQLGRKDNLFTASSFSLFHFLLLNTFFNSLRKDNLFTVISFFIYTLFFFSYTLWFVLFLEIMVTGKLFSEHAFHKNRLSVGFSHNKMTCAFLRKEVEIVFNQSDSLTSRRKFHSSTYQTKVTNIYFQYWKPLTNSQHDFAHFARSLLQKNPGGINLDIFPWNIIPSRNQSQLSGN